MKKTTMLALLFTLVVSVVARGQDVRADLAKALASGTDEEQFKAVEAAATDAAPETIALIAKAIRASSPAVKEAAIVALGAMKSPNALAELHGAYWKNQGLRGNDHLFALLLKNIGRNGSTDSLRALTDHPFRHLTTRSGTARILGIGNIRDRASVEALMKAWRLGGGHSRRGVDSRLRGHFREQFRVALAVLTGEDFGTSREEWAKWWRGNRGSFVIDPERPEVAKAVRKAWERYWGASYSGKNEPPPAWQPPFKIEKDPDATTIRWAVKGLRDALAAKDEATIIPAIENSAGIGHPDVVSLLARGLRSRSAKVRMATVFALGWNPNAAALRQLHRMYRREKDLSKQEELFAELLKAIGRHGSESSLTVLAADPFKRLTLASGRARIYGLARIRSKESVETLMKAMRLGGGTPARGRRSAEPRFMDAIRVALAVLTGVDHGESKDAWQAWWKKNRKKFRPSRDRPPIPEDLTDRWEAYWGEPYGG